MGKRGGDAEMQNDAETHGWYRDGWGPGGDLRGSLGQVTFLAQGLAQGHVQGLAQGHAQGHVHGHAQGLVQGRERPRGLAGRLGPVSGNDGFVEGSFVSCEVKNLNVDVKHPNVNGGGKWVKNENGGGDTFAWVKNGHGNGGKWVKNVNGPNANGGAREAGTPPDETVPPAGGNPKPYILNPGKVAGGGGIRGGELKRRQEEAAGGDVSTSGVGGRVHPSAAGGGVVGSSSRDHRALTDKLVACTP